MLPTSSNSTSPPDISPHPSSSATSAIGSRTRHRSGTLPTSLPVSNSSHKTSSPTPPPITPPTLASTPASRLRSLSNTIWNDDLNSNPNLNSSFHPQLTHLNPLPPIDDFNAFARPRSQTYAATLQPNNLNNLQFLQQQQQQQQVQQQQQQQIAQAQYRNQFPPSIARGSSFSFSNTLQLPLPTAPILQDNIPENAITLTSSHTNQLLGPTNTLLFIHIPKDPHITNSKNFYPILKKFGPILSIRTIVCNDTLDLVLIVEFHDLESSINCKSSLQNCELYPGMKCSIAFAKILSQSHQPLPTSSNSISTTASITTPANGPAIATAPSLTPTHTYSSNPLDALNMQINSLKSHDIIIPNILTPNNSNSINNNGTSTPAKISLEPETPYFTITSLNDRISSFKKIQNHILSQFPNLLSDTQMENANSLLANALQYSSIKASNLGPLPPQVSNKLFDNPSLRELRKQLDSNSLSNLQIEETALAMDSELPELASDYLGNTIVQKLLDTVGPVVRDNMVTKLIPYLSQMSAHKNGTWAAQKLINTVQNEKEMQLVSKSLTPYAVHLFNDTYANYVIHGVLKFNYPYSNFIFESLICCFLDISFNRFGARAARTCLETIESDSKINEKIQNEVILLIIIAILTWCFELMSDVNGSLLITWFLETCQFLDNKHLFLSYVLTHEDEFTDGEITTENKESDDLLTNDELEILKHSEKFIKLCTLKLGTLSILKILNYRTDLAARDLILSKIFGPDIFNNDLNFETKNQSSIDEFILKAILLDLKPDSIPTGSNHGANLIHKILSIPTLDPIVKMRIIHKIKLILTDIISEYGSNITNNSIRRLAEECGIRGFQSRSSRNSFSNGNTLANLNSWKSRSRSNSNITNGDNSPALYAANNSINKNIDYDILLRQQLDELSLNNTQNVVNNNIMGMNMNNNNMNGMGMSMSMGMNNMNMNSMGMMMNMNPNANNTNYMMNFNNGSVPNNGNAGANQN
ncbi:hypothetical protein CANINC_000572 [Pichia inconspicua]|uniref:PUM-HD domain-containing protein n=1 Tax=Pichia inconspicua TaxID=52247 RepID=A0A4T0X5S7_9ASCO|nr:hypothetical protein CANINC_000572 [[Candida] inconspicua]